MHHEVLLLKGFTHDSLMSLWGRPGNYVQWGESAIARNAAEHGGKAIGDPTCVLRSYRDEPLTVLGAEGPWWREFMSVHGKDWNGPFEDNGREMEDWISRSRGSFSN